MPRRDHIDLFGATALTLFSLLLAFNQVVIKVVNEGLQPVFFAGLRSVGATALIGAWILYRRRRFDFVAGTNAWGLLIGSVFAAEFVFLFVALDLTTVTRTSIIFYTMPVWLALAAHFLIPGDRIGPAKALGLALAFGGVVWAIVDRGGAAGGQASLWGDLAALAGAMAWAGIALIAKASPFNRLHPEMQLFWQLLVSGPLLLLVAPLFGPLVRELAPIHLWGLAFQIVVIASAGFLAWLWLLGIYPASGVASFSFLSPVFGVFLGWLLLGEHVGPSILASGALVAVGLFLINRPQPA